MYCSNLTYRVDTNSRWQIYCSGPDFTWIIYAISKFHGMIHTWSCVLRICACREVFRLARISCHIERVVSIKALVGVSPDSFVVPKYITI